MAKISSEKSFLYSAEHIILYPAQRITKCVLHAINVFTANINI